MTRKQAREQAFILGFESLFTEDTVAEIAETFSYAMGREVDPFALSLCHGIEENIEVIDQKIEAHLTGWKIGRISRVSLALLRIAVYEILKEADIPESVSINEAVELSKKYGTDKSYRFVNGILASIAKELSKEEEQH